MALHFALGGRAQSMAVVGFSFCDRAELVKEAQAWLAHSALL